MTSVIPADYLECARHDVAALALQECRRILEVCTGFGALGRILTQRGAMQLDAVEINPSADEYLRNTYRKHWIGNIETLSLDSALPDYNCVIFPDVLKHLVDPWNVLARLCGHLRSGGYVVASLPNMRNIGLHFKLLIQGRWETNRDKCRGIWFVVLSIVKIFIRDIDVREYILLARRK